jgi:UMF1 family MFS transporter
VYGAEELRLTQTDLVGAIVVVQIVAFVGAISSGRVAARIGGFKTVFGSLFIWAGVIFAGFFLPAESPLFFFLLAALIGFVLGGTQALSRSLFSQLVPDRREAEYFALYQAMERGTSWLGTLTFGLAFQFSGSYRPGLLALLAFFLIGGFLLTKVNMREGIDAAGNKQPQII